MLDKAIQRGLRLQQMAAQEGCDGEPYDEMQDAANSMSELVVEIDHLRDFMASFSNKDDLVFGTFGGCKGPDRWWIDNTRVGWVECPDWLRKRIEAQAVKGK